MFSAITNNINVLKLLLANNADINVADNKGETALMLASSFGHRNVVELFLKYRADVNITNKYGQMLRR